MLSSAIYSNDFIGHVDQIGILEGLLNSKRIPHALLLTGPDGIGKCLAANWLCAAFLCAKSGCGDCPVCSRVLKQIHPDHHIVAAEHGRRDIVINQIRNLNSAISTKPFESAGKTAVIDEADRMNEESQNAFLKTLEEPPPQTMIVLVSSRPEGLLQTIRSRCQRFVFSRLSDEDLNRFIKNREDLNSDLPFKLADGRPGRYLKLIEVDGKYVRKLFIDFISSVSSPSPVRTSSKLMEWAKGGDSRQELREKLGISCGLAAGLIRDIIVIIEGGESHQIKNLDFEIKLLDAAKLYEVSSLYYAFKTIVETAEDIAGYVDPGLAVENIFRVLRDLRK